MALVYYEHRFVYIMVYRYISGVVFTLEQPVIVDQPSAFKERIHSHPTPWYQRGK